MTADSGCYLAVGAALFVLGGIGFVTRRNLILIFLSVELMLHGVSLTLLTFGRMHGNLDGQVTAFFVMVVAAAEVVVGLAIIMTIFRTRNTASVDEPRMLKW